MFLYVFYMLIWLMIIHTVVYGNQHVPNARFWARFWFLGPIGAHLEHVDFGKIIRHPEYTFLIILFVFTVLILFIDHQSCGFCLRPTSQRTLPTRITNFMWFFWWFVGGSTLNSDLMGTIPYITHPRHNRYPRTGAGEYIYIYIYTHIYIGVRYTLLIPYIWH